MFHSQPPSQIPLVCNPYQAHSEQSLRPPGTDPYHNSAPNTLTFYARSLPQIPFHGQVDGVHRTLVASLADPTRYDSVPVTPTVPNSTGTSISTPQAALNNLTTSIANVEKVSQPISCEVCNALCTSLDIFQKHISGKKHQRALLEKSCLTHCMTFPENIDGISGGTLLQAINSDLETKRQKLLIGGATSDSVRVCTVCNVACNSLEAFTKHLSGRKHAAQAALVASGGAGPYIALARAQVGVSAKPIKKPKFVQPVWCDVCQLSCNSRDVYANHILGQKHRKNLEAKPGKPVNMCIGPAERPEEGVESKKKKVIEGGAEASAVRICGLCNVVCNSQAVFDSHLRGQKHAAMLKKPAEANAGYALALSL